MLKLVCNNCGVTILETRCSTFFPLVLPLVCALLLTVVGLLCIVFYLGCIFVTSCVLFYYVCIAVLNTLVAGLLAGSQYPEGPATGHLGTCFSWFPCVYKRMLRWFQKLQVATACFSCSPPDLDFRSLLHICYLNFIFMYMHNNHCHRVTAHLQPNILYIFQGYPANQRPFR